MNWRLEKACSLTVRGGANSVATVVKVCLVAELLDRFCIGICLLKEGLIDGLDLVDTNAGGLFTLRRSTRATSIELGKGKAILVLDAVELERWMHFTLRAVRDGAAEVDHFDLDATSTGQTHESVEVVVVFPSSLAPVSPNEARRRLGLSPQER
jgi:hypothetical protein